MNRETKKKGSRTAALQTKYPRNRQFTLPVEGRGGKYVESEIEKAMNRNPANFGSHQEMAKPGTLNDRMASKAYYRALKANPNNVDPHMWLGSYELEREAMSMTAGMLNHEDPENVGGWFLNGGTEAILQATWMYRNKYFFSKASAPKDGFNIRKNGWLGLYEKSKKKGIRKKSPTPKILAPINSHFALNKAADILGIGQDNIEYFFLDENGRPDPKSAGEKARKIMTDGNEIMMTWVTVGDTTRGALADVGAIDREVMSAIEGKQDYTPPTIVDAAAQYLFAAVMGSSDKYADSDGNRKEMPAWDFRVKNVHAIVADPHKNQIPYPASILLIRDPQDTSHTIMDTEYLSLDLMKKAKGLSKSQLEATSHSATIPTSRSGYGPAATWAYYVGHGLDKIRKRKEKIWGLVNYLEGSIKKELGDTYEPLYEPDSAIVSFAISKKWIEKNKDNLIDEIYDEAKKSAGAQPPSADILAGVATYKVYEGINDFPDDFLYLGRSEELKIKTEKDFEEFKRQESGAADTVTYNYMGLIAHVMEHNRKEDVDLLVRRLKEEAGYLLRAESITAA